MQLVREFVSAVREGRPLVKQMLMGGGKTTVVGPLLALILGGDGERLVVQTMPPALIEQSRATLRATFSSIVRKRVFTLSFDRSSELRWATVEKRLARFVPVARPVRSRDCTCTCTCAWTCTCQLHAR